MAENGAIQVLGIEAGDYDSVTRYGKAFRKKLVYAPLAQKENFHVVERFDHAANPTDVRAAVASARLVTGMGHGSYDGFTGHGGELIWDAAGVLPGEFRGKFVHFLSCQTAALLGLSIVGRGGATAFWGYDVNFTFYSAQQADPATDPFAKWYFELDAIIDIAIAEGESAHEIYSKLESQFIKDYPQVRRMDPDMAAAYLDNFVHLMCPVKNWGRPDAKLD